MLVWDLQCVMEMLKADVGRYTDSFFVRKERKGDEMKY